MTRQVILEEAIKCVCTDREQQYGKPEDNFQAISNLWEDYLLAKYRIPIALSAEDVAVMMIQVKIARVATGTAKMDSFVDLAGYAACAGEIATTK